VRRDLLRSHGTNEEEGFVGPAIKGVDLQLLEPDADATQVRVRSAAVGDGYFPQPEPGKLGDGSFLPDDLLRISPAGARIVGRLSDVINVAGKKVNPAEVEAHLLDFEGVRQAVVFGRASTVRNQEVVACVVAAEETMKRRCSNFAGRV
jgi:acyl-coenzyme A synthetase/AMP-(fatty) acid ligase